MTVYPTTDFEALMLDLCEALLEGDDDLPASVTVQRLGQAVSVPERDDSPTVSVWWHQPTDTDEFGVPFEGYYVAQVDTENDYAPMRVYVNDGVVFDSDEF